MLDEGVTAVISTDKTLSTQAKSETFEHHALDAEVSVLRAMHDACDFVHESLSEGGVVFIHSRAGFSRSDWAVLIALGYMVKYQNVKLREAVENLGETTKHSISPTPAHRRDLLAFEEESLGETSVSESWVTGSDDQEKGTKNHSLSRRKLAENLNDRRLLKKKSPHK